MMKGDKEVCLVLSRRAGRQGLAAWVWAPWPVGAGLAHRVGSAGLRAGWALMPSLRAFRLMQRQTCGFGGVLCPQMARTAWFHWPLQAAPRS